MSRRRYSPVRWIPKADGELRRFDIEEVTGADAVVYKYRSGDAPYAVAYHGKANRHDWHHRFANDERREKFIAEYFAGRVKHAEYKEQTKRQGPSTHATAAADIRRLLKAANIAASVTSDSYSGGNSVDVRLTDATPDVFEKARAIAEPYQYGHFDGMTDCYEYSNKRSDLAAQVKFVHVSNQLTAATEQRVWDFVRGYFGGAEGLPASYAEAQNKPMGDGTWVSNFVHRQFAQADSAYWTQAKAA